MTYLGYIRINNFKVSYQRNIRTYDSIVIFHSNIVGIILQGEDLIINLKELLVIDDFKIKTIRFNIESLSVRDGGSEKITEEKAKELYEEILSSINEGKYTEIDMTD